MQRGGKKLNEIKLLRQNSKSLSEIELCVQSEWCEVSVTGNINTTSDGGVFFWLLLLPRFLSALSLSHANCATVATCNAISLLLRLIEFSSFENFSRRPRHVHTHTHTHIWIFFFLFEVKPEGMRRCKICYIFFLFDFAIERARNIYKFFL